MKALQGKVALVTGGSSGIDQAIAIRLGADGASVAINYGASPGDDHIADPYLYVGPHAGPPPGDPAFWNAPFGAARTFRQIGTVAEATAFFRDGRARAVTTSRRTS